MYALQIFVRRNRKMLLRGGVLALLGLGGLFAMLPRADANGPSAVSAASLDRRDLLLSPEPLTDPLFSALYAPTQGWPASIQLAFGAAMAHMPLRT